MGVLVDTNNWASPSPPKKKWMMHYLEEFPSSEEKSSSPCYTNGVISRSPPSPAVANLHLNHTYKSLPTPITSTQVPHTSIVFNHAKSSPSRREESILSNGGSHPIHPAHVNYSLESQLVPSQSSAAPIISTASKHYTLHIDQHHQASAMVAVSKEAVIPTNRADSAFINSIGSIGDPHNYIHHPHNPMVSMSESHNGKRRTAISGIREVHNKLEKNRRAHLKECFEILKRQVPPAQEEKKSSNLSILHSAIRYIQFLRRREREFEHEMERLAREKINQQQRLAMLKKELSARWEHIDFNTLIPENMEIEMPYEENNYNGGEVYVKDRLYMDEESRMITGNGVGSGSDHGDMFNSSSASNSLKCGDGTMYSSSSSLSSTMSPLGVTPISYGASPSSSLLHTPGSTVTYIKHHNIQVLTTSAAASTLPIQFIPSPNVRILPTSAAGDQQHAVALTVHNHSNGIKSRHDSASSPRSNHSNSPSTTLSPLSSAASSPSTVIVSDVTTTSSAPTFIKFNSTGGATQLSPRSLNQTVATAVSSTLLNNHFPPGATLVKTDNINGPAKLVSLSSVPNLVSTTNGQLLLPTSQIGGKLSHPQVIKTLPNLQPIPSLQPISTNHQIILKPSTANGGTTTMLMMPQTQTSKPVAKVIQK